MRKINRRPDLLASWDRRSAKQMNGCVLRFPLIVIFDFFLQALAYFNILRIQPISEALDDDASG